MKILLDTNVLLVSISSKSKYHWLYQKLLNQEFDLIVSNEILLEYEEIISQKYSKLVARDVLKFLLVLPNVHKVSVYYNWNLITDDRDDNKFVDCAISANAHLLVTNDKHFNKLKTLEFPKVQVIDINTFFKLFENSK